MLEVTKNQPPAFSNVERNAIWVGIMDGENALNRSRVLGFIPLFEKAKAIPLADKRLETLRAYTEMARTLLPTTVPTTILADAGFSPFQIVELVQIIVRRVGVSIRDAAVPARLVEA